MYNIPARDDFVYLWLMRNLNYYSKIDSEDFHTVLTLSENLKWFN